MARQIVVDIIGDSTKFTKATNDVVKATVTMESRLDRVKKSLMTGFGAGVGISAVDLASRGLSTVVDYMKDATAAASDQAEAQSKVNVVFGQQSRVITQWASTAARAMGMSKTAALDAAGSLGNLFDGLGLAEDATVSMSKNIVQLAADLGSFNNVSTDEALTALKAGLLGEAEPMRRFGVALNETAVQSQAAKMGLVEMIKVGGKLKPYISDAAKIQARYALILEGTANAQGDFARTADGMANSQKTLDAALEDLSAEVGKFLVGPAKDLVHFFTMLVAGSRTSGGAIQEFLNQQRQLRGEVNAGKDPLDVLTRGLASLVAQTDETKVITAEAAREFNWLGRMAGQTAQDIMDLWKFYREGGASVEEATRLVKDFLRSVVLTGETTTAVTPLLTSSWKQMMGVAVEAGHSIYGGLVRPVKRAMHDMFKTASDAKGPWKAAMKALRDAGRDPFEDKDFAGWMERKAAKFVRRAQREFRQGKGDMRKEARALAYVMTNPVLVALAKTQEEIQALANARLVIDVVEKRLGGFRRNGNGPAENKGNRGNGNGNGNGGGNGGGGGGSPHQPSTGKNARGTSGWRGGWSWVGEQGPELMNVPTGTVIKSNPESMAMAAAAGGGGNAYTINVNVAPGGDLVQTGRQIVEAIRQYERRSGKVWRAA